MTTTPAFRGFRLPAEVILWAVRGVGAASHRGWPGCGWAVTLSGMPFKHNAARRHRIPKARYRVQNWPAYETGLRRRGDLTLWLEEAAIAGWQAPRRTTPGGQARYSDAAIELVLMLRLCLPSCPAPGRGLHREHPSAARAGTTRSRPHDIEPPQPWLCWAPTKGHPARADAPGARQHRDEALRPR